MLFFPQSLFNGISVNIIFFQRPECKIIVTCPGCLMVPDSAQGIWVPEAKLCHGASEIFCSRSGCFTLPEWVNPGWSKSPFSVDLPIEWLRKNSQHGRKRRVLVGWHSKRVLAFKVSFTCYLDFGETEWEQWRGLSVPLLSSGLPAPSSIQ